MNFRILLSYFFIVTSLSISAQGKIKVSGTVMDVQENHISSAHIYVDMKRAKAISNKKGKYKLKLDRGTKLVTIFHPDYGYVNQEYKGNRRMDFIFKKVDDPISLTEFEALGYDSTIKETRDQNLYSSYTSVFEILDKTFNQVRVVNGKILVGRGGPHSVTTVDDPHILVEGMQMSPESLNAIPTQDIKHIRVIHRGSELAEYGLQGKNGVIIVRLKNGEEEG